MAKQLLGYPSNSIKNPNILAMNIIMEKEKPGGIIYASIPPPSLTSPSLTPLP